MGFYSISFLRDEDEGSRQVMMEPDRGENDLESGALLGKSSRIWEM